MTTTNRPIRWGILATGWIAREFVTDLSQLPDHQAVAVGSRTQATADAFAAEFGIARAYSSYESLVTDPEVDVVYVATPHPAHLSAALMAIENGKAVLVEKPFTLNAAQARQLIDAARGRGTFLMEAMWARFTPKFARLREVVASGILGDLVYLTAEHGQSFAPDPEFRLFAPDLGGGALLDLGIYPVSFAHMVFGPPTKITAVSTAAFTGVDATTSVILQYADGKQAVLTTSLAAASNNPAGVYGSAARVEIDGWFYRERSFTVTATDGRVLERYHEPYSGWGLRFQAAEVGRCLREGLTESPILTLDETLAVMHTMDEIRRQIGLIYPGE
jgi:predicted dehydrogenase